MPLKLQCYIAESSGDFEPIQIGMSGAQTYRLLDQAGNVCYLKIGPATGIVGIRDEMQRLQWSTGRLPVPPLLAYAEEEAQSYLLTSGLPGENVADLVIQSHAKRACWVTLLAQGLRQIHAQPWQDCPFDHRFAAMFEMARQHTAQRMVDESEFDAVRQGRRAQELLDELAQLAPQSEELCLTHGDYCLPNIIVDDDCVAGFVDLGRLGVGDRYRDLALVRRSLDYNGCADLIPHFFQEYGLPTPNADKLYLYQLLDEFF
ncbi:MAG: aminoglycoside 3'-phosphotransferase [Caldilineaceae bacterium]|nr:aminoglycoside 3'-phosphotransferase [Caldilineaceae bacterium]